NQEWRREPSFAPHRLQLSRESCQAGRVGEVVAKDQHRANFFIQDQVTQSSRNRRSAKARRHHLTDCHVEREGCPTVGGRLYRGRGRRRRRWEGWEGRWH